MVHCSANRQLAGASVQLPVMATALLLPAASVIATARSEQSVVKPLGVTSSGILFSCEALR